VAKTIKAQRFRARREHAGVHRVLHGG
jgi:hypothetical protein